VSPLFVELSGESSGLAQAEARAVAEVLGGRVVGLVPGTDTVLELDLAVGAAPRVAERLALAHRCLVPVTGPPTVRGDHVPGASAVFRPFRRPTSGTGERGVLEGARTWKASGGTIDLVSPDHRFWLLPDAEHGGRWLEEVAPVDRKAVASRRISALPFRRPVGLDPRLARAAANLARVPPGGRVVDPFLGTGALLAEAALLGARVVGIDRDPTMVRGALTNFAHLGLTAEAMVIGDAGEVDGDQVRGPFDAVLSDLPYGRASGTGGEDAGTLARRVVPRWAERVRSGGRIVLVVPGGEDPVEPPWRRFVSVPVRVHRSLTREFRVYERGP
jgi:tRNA (guanine10-N2)-dimethyltransferase